MHKNFNLCGSIKYREKKFSITWIWATFMTTPDHAYWMQSTVGISNIPLYEKLLRTYMLLKLRKTHSPFLYYTFENIYIFSTISWKKNYKIQIPFSYVCAVREGEGINEQQRTDTIIKILTQLKVYKTHQSLGTSLDFSQLFRFVQFHKLFHSVISSSSLIIHSN